MHAGRDNFTCRRGFGCGVLYSVSHSWMMVGCYCGCCFWREAFEYIIPYPAVPASRGSCSEHSSTYIYLSKFRKYSKLHDETGLLHGDLRALAR